MNGKCVKGTLMEDYARMLKANPSINWNDFLTKEDWLIINNRILPSGWYAFDTFQRCGVAIFKLIAKNNLETAKSWGKMRAGQLFKSTYQVLLEANDPITAIKRYIAIRKTFTNFDMFSMELEIISPKHIKIISKSVEAKHEGNEPFTWQIIGSIEKLIELNGGKNVSVKILAKEWQDDKFTISEWEWK